MMELKRNVPVRIDEKTRRIILHEANNRQLKFADIVRQAIREFIVNHGLNTEHRPSVEHSPQDAGWPVNHPASGEP
jgi:hypothetical protein